LSLRARIRALQADERGFVLVLAVSLVTLVAMVSFSLMTLAQGEDSHSRRDQAKDGSFQAAEAGTNAYLSDLTESVVFYNAYMARGEATRTDTGNVAHPNDCSVTCSNLAWTAATAWTYKTTPVSDPGWLSLGNGYDYLIRVYPPNGALNGLAQVITRIDVTGRPHGSTDVSRWHTIETIIRPASLTDFQAFLGSSITYAVGAVTTGPIFAGEDDNGNVASITHNGTAMANLYAEGTVTVSANTLQNSAKKYDQSTSPTALCKLNNCTPVPFSSFGSTISVVQGAAAGPGGISLGSTDASNSALSNQSPAFHVDAWKLVFLSNGTVTYASCKKVSSTTEDYVGLTAPTCGTPSAPKAVPAVGAIYSAVDVLVSGVVKGKVTIATPGDIVYAGNLTYVADGTDVIGLEAQGAIYIAPWALDPNGNITIYGAQLALTGQWTDDANCSTNNNYSNCHASSSVCSAAATTHCIMTFYGSSALEGTGGGANSSAIGLSNMFRSRLYNYDNNLVFLQPPWFPNLGNAFTILVQREL
jgi:hypothetical protein